MNIVFAGTPQFAAIQLQALIDAKHNIVAVYTQPDIPAGRGQHMHASPVKELALQHHIPVEQPTSLKTAEAQTTLASYKPDVMIVAAYGLLLPKPILDLPGFGCINVHASLLPRWRGASPIQQAILTGDAQSGITLMKMDIGLDTGDILAQKACVITPSETASSLHDKLSIMGAEILIEKLYDITHHPQPIPQNPTLVTHAGKISKEQAQVWHRYCRPLQ
jgi:methionyl-tRNA formyltransferase